MPEQGARRILPCRGVERREALVGLALGPRIVRALRSGEQLVGQARHVAHPQLATLPRDPAQRVPIGGRRSGAPERRFLVSQALVLVRRLQVQEDPRVARGLRRASLSPRGRVVERLRREALAEQPKRDVARAGTVRFEEALGRERLIPAAEEQRLAQSLERVLHGVRGRRTALAHPPEHFLDIAGATRVALGEERGDGERRRCPVRSLEQLGARGPGELPRAGYRLDTGRRSADPVVQRVGEKNELGAEVPLAESRDRANGRLAGRVCRPGGPECLEGATRIARSLGDERRRERTLRTLVRRARPRPPRLDRSAHFGRPPPTERKLEGHRARRKRRRITESAYGGLDVALRPRRRKQPPEAHARAGLRSPRRACGSEAVLLCVRIAGGHGERGDRRGERLHALRRSGRLETCIRRRDGDTREEGNDHAFGRRERRLRLERHLEQGGIP